MPVDEFVVHCMTAKSYDVYVGRGRCPRTGRLGEWGNNWSHLPGKGKVKVSSVAEAVAEHRRWVLSQPDLVARIKTELRGKVLACWCRTSARPNAPCHAVTLAEIANS